MSRHARSLGLGLSPSRHIYLVTQVTPFIHSASPGHIWLGRTVVSSSQAAAEVLPEVNVYCPYAFSPGLQTAFGSCQIISEPHFSKLPLLLLGKLPARKKKKKDASNPACCDISKLKIKRAEGRTVLWPIENSPSLEFASLQVSCGREVAGVK